MAKEETKRRRRTEGEKAVERYEVLARKVDRVRERRIKAQEQVTALHDEEVALQEQADWWASNPHVAEYLETGGTEAGG